MNRREFFALAGAATLLTPQAANSQNDGLEDILKELEDNPLIVEEGWLFRESGVTRGVGKGTPSKRVLSKTSRDLIRDFEIASPKVYEARYRRPIWPKGASGVTIGVGYDLRFANKALVDRDWPMLTQADRSLLYKVCGLGGTKARAALDSVKSVEIHWPAAEAQYLAFLPYPTRETETAFGKSPSGKFYTDPLPDDCFGALVSLVYNRGPSTSRRSKKRIHMYNIKALLAQGKNSYLSIPDQIIAMKKLWEDDPNARGLLRRRDAEALLFKRGLSTL